MKGLLKILLVDDDQVDRMAVRRAFKKTNLKVELVEADNAQKAIAFLQDNNNFDCVFLDYLLPDLDGLELVNRLYSMGIKVPVIVLTGQGDEELAVKIMKAGAYDYLAKSRVSPEVLSHALRQAIRIHNAEIKAELANQRLRQSNKLLRTKNKELEQQREQINLQYLQLQQANRLKSEFLSILSHELRTPMNAILGFSQMLLNHYPEPLTEEQNDMVQRIYNNSQNLLTMINEVLDFSTIEAGRMKLQTETFNLKDLVNTTVEQLSSLAIQKNLNLEVDINLDNALVINDKKGCRCILVNLISNAIKFTSSGEVFVKVSSQQDKVIITVKDTGIGIDSKHLETIFEPFRQIDQTIARHSAGTGLGLAIVYAQIQMMTGKITVESEVDQGSTFRVEIPREVEV